MKAVWKIGVISFLLGMSFSTIGESQEPEPDPPAPPKKAFGIAISPSAVRMSSKAGQSQRVTVRVRNQGVTPTRVLTEVSDVGNVVDEQGLLVREYFPPGTLPFSCATWILLLENDFTLAVAEYKDVTFLVSPPRDSAGGFVCVVFFRGVPLVEEGPVTPVTQPQATIQIQPRLGAMVFYEIEGTVKRTGTLLSFAHEPPAATRPLRIFYLFKNTGNADILISGTFFILDQNKALAAKGDLKPIRTFPGDEGAAETEWVGSLTSGTYRLVVTFELGPGPQEVIVKELDFTVA